MQITLEKSKWVVEIRDSITFAEFQEIDNFFTNRLKVQIVGDEKRVEVDGALDQQMSDKMVQTFLQDCRGDNHQEISTIGLLGRLDVEDGIQLKNCIADKFETLKKKLKPKTKE